MMMNGDDDDDDNDLMFLDPLIRDGNKYGEFRGVFHLSVSYVGVQLAG